MVKRKSSFDREEKKERAREIVRKVSKNTSLSDMRPIVENGALVISKGSEVFFERTKESRKTTCVGTVVTIYDDGSVHVWDETNNEFFLFNWKKMPVTGIDVRTSNEPSSVPAPPGSSFIDEVREELIERGINIDSEKFEREVLSDDDE